MKQIVKHMIPIFVKNPTVINLWYCRTCVSGLTGYKYTGGAGEIVIEKTEDGKCGISGNISLDKDTSEDARKHNLDTPFEISLFTINPLDGKTYNARFIGCIPTTAPPEDSDHYRMEFAARHAISWLESRS